MRIKIDFNLKIFILIFFMIIPFLCPTYIIHIIGKLDTIFMIFKIAIFILLTVIILFDKKIKKNKGIVLVFTFYALQALSCYINNLNMINFILNAIKILGLVLIIWFFSRKNGYELILAFLVFYEIVIFVNFITLLIEPENGLYTITNYITIKEFEEYNYWFLGIDNLHINYYLPAVIISFIYSFYKKESITFRTKLLCGIIITSSIISWSATTLIFAIGLIIYLIFRKKIEESKLLNGINLLIGTFISHLGIVILRIQDLFKFLIIDVLKKDLTFTNRTFIWDDTLLYIKQSPFLGYGQEPDIMRYEKGIQFKAFHSHNLFLELLYTGGILTFLIFIGNLLYVVLKLYKKSNKNVSRLLTYFMIIFLIVSITEVYSLFPIFMIVALVDNYDNIINDINYRKERKITNE